MEVNLFVNVGEETRDPGVLAPLPPDRVTLGWHFTSRNLSFYFCKMGRLHQRDSENYLK